MNEIDENVKKLYCIITKLKLIMNDNFNYNKSSLLRPCKSKPIIVNPHSKQTRLHKHNTVGQCIKIKFKKC